MEISFGMSVEVMQAVALWPCHPQMAIKAVGPVTFRWPSKQLLS
jgi:hypothetical protein